MTSPLGEPAHGQSYEEVKKELLDAYGDTDWVAQVVPFGFHKYVDMNGSRDAEQVVTGKVIPEGHDEFAAFIYGLLIAGALDGSTTLQTAHVLALSIKVIQDR